MVRWCSVDPPMKHPAAPFLRQPVLPLLRVHKKLEKKQKKVPKKKIWSGSFPCFPTICGDVIGK
jgi:hypothetical protein